MGIVETEPDIFYIPSSNMFEDHHSVLRRLDKRAFSLAEPPKPVPVLTLPAKARSLNGSVALSPTVLLLAESCANLIWRIDMHDDEVRACVRLAHESMACNLDILADFPGINGIRFCSKYKHDDRSIGPPSYSRQPRDAGAGR